jgi:pyridoxal phosphate enzyme (YggS family)
MAVNKEKFREIMGELGERVQLVAVSKTKPVEDIQALYDLGQRDFGENYVQELVEKQPLLPDDIRWHFIGHLQSNKVKLIAPFVHLIHGVDSQKLLKEIDKQAGKFNRMIPCLLQVHIALEETKFGFDAAELGDLMGKGLGERLGDFQHIKVSGFMGMASFTEDLTKVREEFSELKSLFDKWFPKHEAILSKQEAIFSKQEAILSMGMSGDYQIAIAEGSNMVRIGSLLFGERNYPKP